MKVSAHTLKVSGFIVYIFITLLGVLFHEMWRDEWQAILLATDLSFSELVAQLKYEGHPILWYLIIKGLYSIYPSQLTVQLFHWMVSVGIAWLILFRFRLSPLYALLIVFGYFFIYEYSVITRNYNLVVLFSLLFVDSVKRRHPVYFLFLFSAIMALTNVYGLLLSAAFTIYILWRALKKDPVIGTRGVFVFLLLQGLLLIFYILFLIPPEDNCFTNTTHWSLFRLIRKIPKGGALIFDGFFPVHIGKEIRWGWNFVDQFLEAVLQNFSFTEKQIQITGYFLKSFLVVPVLVLVVRFFKRSMSVLVFLLSGFLLLYSFQVVIHGGGVRYSGFFFMVLLLSYLLLPDEQRKKKIWLTSILVIHLLCGVVMLAADLKRPFSNAPVLAEYLKENYSSETVLLISKPYLSSSVSGYYGMPVYVMGEDHPVTFTSWNNCAGLKADSQSPERLVARAKALVQDLDLPVLIIFTYSPEDRLDPSDDLYTSLLPKEKKRFTGALSGEDFYVYLVNSK